MKLKKLLLVLTLVLPGLVQAAPILSGTQLIGATDVNVNGTLFDVSFEEGSCISLHTGCDEQSDFVLTSANAVDAMEALLAQVFVGVHASANAFCGLQSCVIGSAFALAGSNNVDAAVLFLSGTSSFVTTTGGATPRTFDTTGTTTDIYAVWSLADVPEPSTIALFLLGVIGLTAARRRLA